MSLTKFIKRKGVKKWMAENSAKYQMCKIKILENVKFFLQKKWIYPFLVILFIIISVITKLSRDWIPFSLSLWLLLLLLILIINFAYGKGISPPQKMIFLIFWIITAYVLVKYFSLSVKEDVWYYGFLIPISNLLTSEFILIWITALYAIFTLLMFYEMRQSRIISQRPNIIARPEQAGEWSLVSLVITNIGGSPAFDVETRYFITKNDGTIEKFYWAHSVLQSMEKVKLTLDNNYIHNFYENNQELKVIITYKDKEKKDFEEKLTFPLKKLLEGIKKTKWAIDKDRGYEISKSLKDIAKEIKQIRTKLNYISYESKQNYINKIHKQLKKISKQNQKKLKDKNEL